MSAHLLIFCCVLSIRYIAGVAAMTIVPPDFSVALYYLEQAKAMIEALRELPDFDVRVCNTLHEPFECVVLCVVLDLYCAILCLSSLSSQRTLYD